MNKKINIQDVTEILKNMSSDLVKEKDFLTELDSAIGDGDLGITISRGFHAINNCLTDQSSSIGHILIQSGINFSNAAGSTMGTLLGIAFVRAGKTAKEKIELTLNDILEMFIAAEDGIIEKGKAKLGDKTLLDALIPARIAIQESLISQNDILVALRSANKASEHGVISSIDLKALVGRARWLGERSIGCKDPGATVIWLIIKSVQKSLEQIDNRH